MFNVLTDTFKEGIKREYRKRKIIVWLISVICLQISFLILLLPSYVYLVSDQKDLSAELAGRDQSSQLSDNPDIVTVFRTTNNKLAALSLKPQSDNLDSLVARIVSLNGANIKLTEIMYATDTATSSTFQLRGVASNRDALLSFSKKLEAEPLFERVNLPVSNFAKDKDINFSVTLHTKI